MLHPSDITGKTFEKGMGGYKQDSVDSFLELVAQDFQQLLDEKEELQKKIEILANKIEDYRNDEDSLRAALIGAQKLGDSVIRESNEKAEKIVREASKKAEFLMSDAKNAISKEQAILSRMKEETSNFKKELLDTYKSHIELILKLADYDATEQKPEKQTKDFIDNSSQADLEQEEIAEVEPESIQEISEEAQEIAPEESSEPEENLAEQGFEDSIIEEAPEETEETSIEEAQAHGKYEELKFGDNYDYLDETPKKSSKGFLKRKR